MSFITVIKLVADLTAASCSAMELFVLLLCFDDGVGLVSNNSGGGLLFALPEPCFTGQRNVDVSEELRIK